MNEMFWLLIPDAAAGPLLAIGGLLLVLGCRRLGGTLVTGVLIMCVLGPIVEGILSQLPPFVALAILAATLIFLWRGVARFFFGSRSCERGCGRGAAGAAGAVSKALLWPVRAAWYLIFPRRPEGWCS